MEMRDGTATARQLDYIFSTTQENFRLTIRDEALGRGLRDLMVKSVILAQS